MDKNLVKCVMMPTALLTKIHKRSEVLRKIEDVDWVMVSQKINKHLKLHFKDYPCATIAGFSQHKNEPDVFPFLKFWYQQGGTCCLPVIKTIDSPLRFYRWDCTKTLVKGMYNILVPKDESEVTPDVILTPLIAFDERGFRLGKGGGYYDRTIQAMRHNNQRPYVIGVAAKEQFVQFLETDRHDQKLDMVVTDSGCITFM